jgi:hypothetical protein
MTDEWTAEEERVRALLRRSDGPVLVRPLHDAPRRARTRLVTQLMAVGATFLVIATAVGVASAINARRAPAAAPSAVVSHSPSPAALPDSAPGFATAEAAASAARQALEGRDFQLLVRLVVPGGWYVRWHAQSETSPMSHGDAVSWISSSPGASWRVDASVIRDAGTQRPLGDKYVTAAVVDFGGWAEQRADIMLQERGGRWYWSSLLLYRPPPLGAAADTVVGYATVTRVSDEVITASFRTVGSRCCSDQSWNGRVVALRRDGTTTYNKAGGAPASSLADSGIGVGSDVWVQFPLDTLALDGSYRLAWIVAMYP